MKLPENTLVKLRNRLILLSPSHIYFSKHFIERLVLRSYDIEVLKETSNQIIKVLKDKMCVIIYQSVVNNGVTRVTVNDRKLVCFFDEVKNQLIIRTIY